MPRRSSSTSVGVICVANQRFTTLDGELYPVTDRRRDRSCGTLALAAARAAAFRERRARCEATVAPPRSDARVDVWERRTPGALAAETPRNPEPPTSASSVRAAASFP